MSQAISFFEITSYGEVKIKVNKKGQQIEHTFYSVPTSIIRKFINASKEPSLQDFEGWVNDARQKREAKYKSDSIGIGPCDTSGFWTNTE
jgi:hypothetical protein